MRRGSSAWRCEGRISTPPDASASSSGSERTSEARTAISNEAGVFGLLAVQPDTYNLRIEQKGFKVQERRGLVVAANDRVSLGDITLQIGEVNETGSP